MGTPSYRLVAAGCGCFCGRESIPGRRDSLPGRDCSAAGLGDVALFSLALLPAIYSTILLDWLCLPACSAYILPRHAFPGIATIACPFAHHH